MYYTVYRIVNKIDGKIYIGCHKTENLNDGYMGSGKYIKNAIKKYGLENFSKELLEIFDNSNDMFKMESRLVTDDFVEKMNNYNLKEGGTGGFDYINKNGLTTKNKDYKEIYKIGKKNRDAALKKLCDDFGVEHILQIPEIAEKVHKKRVELYGFDTYRTFNGKNHSIESKKKMSDAKKGKYDGEDNPSYGTMWIYSLKEKQSKKINKDDFFKWELAGWLPGRKMKFL